MEKRYLPILARGEEYIVHEKSKPGRPIDYSKLPSYEEARSSLISKISTLKDQIKEIPTKYRVRDVVVSMRMAVGYTAKTYYPNDLIRLSGTEDVGSKNWEVVVKDNSGNEKVKSGKDIFLRVSKENLFHLNNLLNLKSADVAKGFIDDVRKIDDIFLGEKTDLLTTFPSEWDDGRVEIVLHPLDGLEDDIVRKFKSLFNELGGDINTIKYRSYYPGPAFISLLSDRQMLRDLIKFNPIRALHPLKFVGVPKTRGHLSSFKLPTAPSKDLKSSITVGMFDGGVIENDLLKGFVTDRNPISTAVDDEFVDHGTGVAGALLYGDLSGYNATAILPTPPVCVESYRVFPLSDQDDIDLYEVIDIIEEVVPKRSDIKVYNLSIGPYGPIGDEVSRFTLALDNLSKQGDKLFCVAVGNDGELADEQLCRIQAPSDVINGLGIGAHTFDKSGEITRASYSCIGQGREGCKIKPDITAFGGCDKHPFHLVGRDGRRKWLDAGTSFATPLVSRRAAEIIGRCNLVDPLVARALLVHSAVHPKGVHDKYLGYGAIPENTEEILGCSENKVTVMYKQKILPKKYAKVNIPFLTDLPYKGMVDISWTIAIATNPNPTHPGDYTLNCIEDVFYPNAYLFEFKSPTDSRKVTKDIRNISEVARLESLGWERSKYPKSASGNQYQSEDERRSINFKWDTIVKKNKNFRYSSLDSPFLILHGMDRGTTAKYEFINYAVVVTVEYKKFTGNAYQGTLNAYSKLETARLRSMAELLIR